MKTITKIFSFTLILMLSSMSDISANQSNNQNMTIVNIAGLVIDCKSLLPIENASVYDEGNNLIASTDKNGYFRTKLSDIIGQEISFKLKIKKDGYTNYIQSENWGNLHNNLNATYYFGIKHQNELPDYNAFSELISNKRDLSYNAVYNGLSDIKEKNDFINKVRIAKSTNENIFFKIDSNYYLISNTGWIKLNSPDDLIIINKINKYSASEINSIIKRSRVKGMSPSEFSNKSFELNVTDDDI